MSIEYYAVQVTKISDNSLQTQTTFLTSKERPEFLKKISKKLISGAIRKMELQEITEQEYRKALKEIQGKPSVPAPEPLDVKNSNPDADRLLEFARILYEHGSDSKEAKKYRSRHFSNSR